MKKIVLILLFLFAAVSLYAQGEPVEIWGAGENGNIFDTVVSPTNATAVTASRIKRLRIDLHNPDSTYDLYISTYAATSSTGLYTIEQSGTYTQEVNPYSGIFYILAATGDQTVNGFEVYR